MTKKKAARFPERPFLSYGSHTLNGRFRTSRPGAYLPTVSYSAAAANRGSRDLDPEPTRRFPISVRWLIETRGHEERNTAAANVPAVNSLLVAKRDESIEAT